MSVALMGKIKRYRFLGRKPEDKRTMRRWRDQCVAIREQDVKVTGSSWLMIG